MLVMTVRNVSVRMRKMYYTEPTAEINCWNCMQSSGNISNYCRRYMWLELLVLLKANCITT